MALVPLLHGASLNAFMGSYVDDATATTEIKGTNLDANGDGTGNPQGGMLYYNTTDDELRFWDAGATAWASFGGTSVHNSLSGLQGGVATEYYHLTSAQHTALTGGGNASGQHIHDDRYFTETEIGSTTGGSEGALLVGTDAKANLGGATTVEAALTSINANILPQSGAAANPNGSVTPRYIGDTYVSTTGANLMWMSYGTLDTTWKLI